MLTDADRDRAREAARASRLAQGVGETITDEASLAKIALVLAKNAPPPRRTGAEQGSTDAIDQNRDRS